jgi:nicotinamide riboside transporter PnuC
MNLGLWGALLANRKRDPQLVAVSIGLGIVVTGAAISYGLRHLTSDLAILPNVFLMLTQLAGWFIWCRAFWRFPRRSPAAESVLPSPSTSP